MHNEKTSSDIMKLYEEIDTTVQHNRTYPEIPRDMNNKYIKSSNTTTNEEYTDTDLHKMCIVALEDLIKDMYPKDQAKVLPKIDWLISELKKKTQVV
jgi:hypothetical protein